MTKIQIDKGNGNKQSSSDPNTVQIQIGPGVLKGVAILVIVAVLILGWALS